MCKISAPLRALKSYYDFNLTQVFMDVHDILIKTKEYKYRCRYAVILKLFAVVHQSLTNKLHLEK